MLDRVFWTGHGGLQLHSAWNVVRDGLEPRTDTPLLLFQLGESSPCVDALDTSRSVSTPAALRDRLVPLYGENHDVIVLYSSGPPAFSSLARQVKLGSLAKEPVPVYSNLWVPGIAGPRPEAEVAPRSSTHETPHPSRETTPRS